jgi:hypothetical protein
LLLWSFVIHKGSTSHAMELRVGEPTCIAKE